VILGSKLKVSGSWGSHAIYSSHISSLRFNLRNINQWVMTFILGPTFYNMYVFVYGYTHIYVSLYFYVYMVFVLCLSGCMLIPLRECPSLQIKTLVMVQLTGERGLSSSSLIPGDRGNRKLCTPSCGVTWGVHPPCKYPNTSGDEAAQ
jgi:hypothetical protein